MAVLTFLAFAAVALVLVLRVRPAGRDPLRGAPHGPRVLRALVWAQAAWFGLLVLVAVLVLVQWPETRWGVSTGRPRVDLAVTGSAVLALAGARRGTLVRRGNGLLPFYAYQALVTPVAVVLTVQSVRMAEFLVLAGLGWAFLLRGDTRAFLAPGAPVAAAPPETPGP